MSKLVLSTLVTSYSHSVITAALHLRLPHAVLLTVTTLVILHLHASRSQSSSYSAILTSLVDSQILMLVREYVESLS